MKKFTLLLILVANLFFDSCKTNQVHISVLEPSPVNLSPNTKRVGIINRSVLNEKNKKANKLHTILNASADDILREGGEEAISGLKNGLLESQRFDTVIVLQKPELRSDAAGIIAPQLDWEQIEKICTLIKLDALFVLELYDTEGRISSPMLNPVNVMNPNVILTQPPRVTFTTVVKEGWRIYVPFSRLVLDEKVLQAPLSYTFNGLVPPLAEAIMARRVVMKQEAKRMGQNYAERVLPYWIRVTRDYYVKPKKNFLIATRKSRTGNWDGAAEIWKKETTNPKRKIAGRACYNMAIVSEVNGSLDVAIQWAQKAYEDYGNKLAVDYVNALKRRKQKSQLLEAQNP